MRAVLDWLAAPAQITRLAWMICVAAIACEGVAVLMAVSYVAFSGLWRRRTDPADRWFCSTCADQSVLRSFRTQAALAEHTHHAHGDS